MQSGGRLGKGASGETGAGCAQLGVSAEAFEEERTLLIHLPRPYAAYTEHECRAGNTSLVRYDRHHYSIDSMAAGRCVTQRSYADRIQVVYKDQVVAEHIRSFKRDGITYDPWYYVDALKKKPGALRDGSPFKQWNDLSQAITRSLSDLNSRSETKSDLRHVLSNFEENSPAI